MKLTSTWACQCGVVITAGWLWNICSAMGALSTELTPGCHTEPPMILPFAK
jgi:hypothetical protein